MPQKAHAASCMVSSFTANVSCHYRGIWVSDALLAETFHNFCRSPRRYGSSVPGPLEARRRASKRKNTNLAYANAAGLPTYESAVILGSRSNPQWWRKSEDNPSEDGRAPGQVGHTENGAFSLLPSWLFTTPNPSAQAFNDVELSGKSGNEASQLSAFARTSNDEHQTLTLIKRAGDLWSLRRAMSSSYAISESRLHLSEFAFRHLLGIHAKSERYIDLAEALCDPIFNPPGSRNHSLFMDHLCSRRITWKAWETTILPALLKAIELGLVATQEIQKIISRSLRIRQKLRVNAHSRVRQDWHRILDAIEQSRVLQLADLDAVFLSRWYRQIETSSHDHGTHLLLWKLRHYSGRPESDLASSFMLEGLHRSVEVGAEETDKLVKWFASLPAELLGPVIHQTTFKLMTLALKNKFCVDGRIELWSDLLPRLFLDPSQETTFSKAMWSQASDSSCGLTSQQQLLTTIWVVTRIWSQRPDATIHVANMEFRDEFERTFASMEGSDQFDRIGKIVLTLDTLPLPNKDQIFPFLQHFTEENLVRMLGKEEHLDQLKSCFRVEYAQLRDSEFVSKAQRAFPEVLQGLAETVNSDLLQFKVMAQALILKSSQNFRIVRQLLRHNFAFRFAASKSWSSSSAETHDTTNSHPGLSPAAALDVLEMLTITYAVAPSSSPRATFRNVVYMYQFLNKVGAPINPIIARAIWHAGVTRYGQVGAPRANLQWCLRKVREIEGKDTADRLLWSAGFRRDYIQGLTRVVEHCGPRKAVADSMDRNTGSGCGK